MIDEQIAFRKKFWLGKNPQSSRIIKKTLTTVCEEAINLNQQRENSCFIFHFTFNGSCKNALFVFTFKFHIKNQLSDA